MITPWGLSDSHEKHACGVHFYGTPSHGGYFVPGSLAEKVPTVARNRAAIQWRTGDWYEEDCAYHVVRLVFPDICEENAKERASGDWCPVEKRLTAAELLEESREGVCAWYGPDVARALGVDPLRYPERVQFYHQKVQRKAVAS